MGPWNSGILHSHISINIIKPSRKRENEMVRERRKKKGRREIPPRVSAHLFAFDANVFFEIELNACRFNHRKKRKLLPNPSKPIFGNQSAEVRCSPDPRPNTRQESIIEDTNIVTAYHNSIGGGNI
jgi:hypothetical protein